MKRQHWCTLEQSKKGQKRAVEARMANKRNEKITLPKVKFLESELEKDTEHGKSKV